MSERPLEEIGRSLTREIEGWDVRAKRVLDNHVRLLEETGAVVGGRLSGRAAREAASPEVLLAKVLVDHGGMRYRLLHECADPHLLEFFEGDFRDIESAIPSTLALKIVRAARERESGAYVEFLRFDEDEWPPEVRERAREFRELEEVEELAKRFI